MKAVREGGGTGTWITVGWGGMGAVTDGGSSCRSSDSNGGVCLNIDCLSGAGVDDRGCSPPMSMPLC